MSDTSGTQAAAETEQKPTLADIVREKTDDGRRIVDFFLDVMEGRIDGAELCHKMDAAKQLEKYKSKAAAKFIARYRGVSCGHAIRGRRGPADPCFDAEGSPAAEPLDASSPFSQHILSVLSVVDDAQLAKLVREKTGDGSTVIQFLDDVMHARLSGFRCHHRIAAAKELALHIVRDEAPASDPAETPATARAERVEAPRDDAPAWTRWPWDYRHAYSFALENPREALVKAENDPDHPIHGYFKDSRNVRASIESVGGVLGPDGLLTSQAPTLEPAPAKAGVPAKKGTHPAHPNPAEGPQQKQNNDHPSPKDSSPSAPSAVKPSHPVEGAPSSQLETKNQKPKTRTPRRLRRQEGDARARMRRNPARNRPYFEQEDLERKDHTEKPRPVGEPVPNLWERRMKKRLEEHWHAPDPMAGSGRIDSTSPSRSPP